MAKDINRPLAIALEAFTNEYGRVVTMEGELWPALELCPEFVIIKGSTTRSEINHSWTRREAEYLYEILGQLLGKLQS